MTKKKSNQTLKTWIEWDQEKIGGVMILDPDGFRDFPANKLYSREEFLRVRRESTVLVRREDEKI